MADNEKVLTQPIFELEKCILNENGVEFCQKLIGNVLCGLAMQNYVVGRQNWCPIKQVCSPGTTTTFLVLNSKSKYQTQNQAEHYSI